MTLKITMLGMSRDCILCVTSSQDKEMENKKHKGKKSVLKNETRQENVQQNF